MKRVIVVFLVGILAASCTSEKKEKKPSYAVVNTTLAQIAKSAEKGTGIRWASTLHTGSSVPLVLFGTRRYDSSAHSPMHHIELHRLISRALDGGTSVILLIGDGMGFFSMELPVAYARMENRASGFKSLLQRGRLYLLNTYTEDGHMPDSASTGTSIATGTMTIKKHLGVAKDGTSVPSLMEIYSRQGIGTGIVTNTAICHATPAAFYAHTAHRSQMFRIARFLEKPGVLDLIMGGGKDYFTQGINESYALLRKMEKNGWKVIFDYSELGAMDMEHPVVGLLASGHMAYEVDRIGNKEPSLRTMSLAAFQKMEMKKQFFLMIESGRIDHAAHSNDIGAYVKELMVMDHLILNLIGKIEGKRNVLLIVTADHETAGPVFTVKNDTMKLGKQVELFTKQKASLASILMNSKNSDDFVKQLEEKIPYKIDAEKAKKAFLYYQKNRK